MASGNRRPGPRTPKFDTESTYINLPKELAFTIKAYAQHMRYTSNSLAIQLLLESHPALVQFARTLYDSDNSTSPPPSPDKDDP